MTKTLIPNPQTPLIDFVEKAAGLRVLVIGDIMLDRFIYGDVNRISPEGPVPVLSIRRETAMLGGAGNVLSNLAGLGISADVIAVVGQDAEAEIIRDLIRDHGSNPDSLIHAEDRPTTIKTRFIAGGQHLMRSDDEQTGPVVEGLEHKVIAAIERAVPHMRAVILSDYGKGVMMRSVIQAAIRAAAKAGIPVLVDPKGPDYSIYKGASIITPNRKELGEAYGAAVKSDSEITAAAEALIRQNGFNAIVATRSEEGMSIVHKGSATHLKTQAREVYDVSGAGDTVIATLAAMLAAGADLVDAAQIANAAAGIVVGKIGTAPILKDELITVLQANDSLRTPGVHQALFLPLRAAAAQVEQWKARGLRIGFTNGCFDVLHSGHVGYLAQARARCDRLIVAINADSSVRRLKGPTRPVNDELSRAKVLAALGCVDLVVLFGDDMAEQDTPLTVIRALTPDLLVKGGDYTVESVVGADYVMSAGGEVWLAPLEEGKSTTATLQKMALKA